MLKYIPEDIKIIFREIPSEVSLGINLSQCPNNCPYCSEPYLAKNIGDELNIETLLKLININEGITCVCFMGGDSNKKQIEELAAFVKDTYPKIQVGWYSGKYEIPENVQYFDYIKLGPYIKERGPLTDRNTNQRMYHVLRDDSDLILKDITNVFWRN